MSDEVADLAIRLSGDVGGFVAAMHQATTAGDQAAAAASKVGGSQKAAAEASKSASSKFKDAAGEMGKGGLAVTAGFAAAGYAALGAVKSAASFETTLRQTAIATNAPASALKDLSALAIKMGADTVFSAQDAAGAMLELAKSGMNPAQIKAGALASTLTLASAGGLDLAESAGYVTSGLSLFSLSAEKSADVAGALAGAANASKASVQDMGMALSQVGPGAANAGLSLQETTAVLAAFAQNGILGSDAGTSLKTMLARLVPQTDKAKGAMEDLGLKFTDAHGSFLPIANVAQQLHDKLGPLSEAQRTTALNTIFGSDASRAATVLMKEGAKGVVAYTKATSDKTQAEKLAKAATSGTAGAMSQLSGSVDTAKLAIGMALAPALVVLAHWLTEAANKVGPLVAWFQQHRTTTIAVAAALGVVLVGAIVAVTVAMVALVFASSPITLTFVAIVAAVAGVVAGLVALWNTSEKARAIMRTVFFALETAVYGFALAAVTVFKQVVTIYLGMVDALVSGAAKAFGWVPGIGPKLKAANAAFDSFKDGALHAMDQLQGGLKSRMDAAARETQVRAELVAAAGVKSLRDRLPMYEAIASKYGITLPEVLKKAGLSTQDAAALLGQRANEGMNAGITPLKATAAKLAAIPAAAFKDSDTRTAAVAYASGLKTGDAIAQGIEVGMKNGIRQVSAVGKQLGAVAANAARHGAEVFSPSKITIYTGEQIGEGLIVGMRSKMAAVQAASISLGAAAAATGGKVSLPDLKAAQARANQTPVEKAQLDELRATDALAQARLKAAATARAVQPAYDAYATASRNAASAAAAQSRAEAARDAGKAGATAHAAALRSQADAEAQRARAMPSATAAQQAAKKAATDHAAALAYQAREAGRAATALNQHGAAAVKAAKAASDAADKAAAKARDTYLSAKTGAADAAKAVTDAAAAALEAHTALADAVYAATADKARAFTDGISAQLDVLVGKANDMRGAFASAVTAGSSLGDLFSKGAPDGGMNSLSGVINSLGRQVEAAKTFAGMQGELAAAGLSDSLINQISAAGVDQGTMIARQILAGGPEAIAQLNDLTSQLADVASTGLDDVVAGFYGQGASALQQLAEGMRAGFPELDAVLKEIGGKVTSIFGTAPTASTGKTAVPAPVTATRMAGTSVQITVAPQGLMTGTPQQLADALAPQIRDAIARMDRIGT